ncbi:ECF transporter S component [Oscillospiraceae bacterium HV4-5-C5C]|nr:ECF transporter S component [Oscillospiraceae bacterium HV4-5-C5C]
MKQNERQTELQQPNSQKRRLRRQIFLVFFVVLEVVMTLVPFLGFIPVGPVNATTLHLPVILAGMLLGWQAGLVTGFTFGLLSMLRATFQPDLTSFIFSPFITISGYSGNLSSVFIAFVPRLLMGLTAALLSRWLLSLCHKKALAYSISALIASMCNTILVLAGIYLFHRQGYSHVIQVSVSALFGILAASITGIGLVEAILAVMICVPIVMALQKGFKDLLV